MLRDLLICVLSSCNILIFSFIGLNYEAFEKVTHFEVQNVQAALEFDQITLDLQQSLMQKKAVVKRNHRSLGSQPRTAGQNSQPRTAGQYLVIPKIHLIAPITSGEDIDQALQQGVLAVQANHSSQTILFGHSSDYPWNRNPYSTIFTLLPKLEPGDNIEIIRGEETLAYTVQKTSVTDPQLSGLVGNFNSENQLILSTCYPIGFYSKRFNVIASPIKS